MILRLGARLALRNKLRFVLTAIGVGAALLAFLLTESVVASWYESKISPDSEGRVLIRHALTVTSPLFTNQAEKIRELPGVREVSWMCWFAGYYKDEKEKFTQIAVESESYFSLYPEFRPPESEWKAFLADPTGAVVGRALATKYGWGIGDRITLGGTIYPGNWPLTIRGIYDGRESTDLHRLYFHWKYLNDKLPGGNHVQRILARLERPEAAAEIDKLFANSRSPTKTENEAEVEKFWSSWSETIVYGIRSASIAIVVVLGLVLGNSIAMATREATPEYAAMRAIGFRSGKVMWVIMTEGLMLAVAGIAVAFALAPAVFSAVTSQLEATLGGSWSLSLDLRAGTIGILAVFVISLTASVWPALRVRRQSLVSLLRQEAGE